MKVNGEAVKAIRRAQKRSLRSVAAGAGIDVGFLSKIENGVKGATNDTIECIAAELEVTVGAISHPDPPQALAREEAIEQIVGMLRTPVVTG